jgi:hypothetical protein
MIVINTQDLWKLYRMLNSACTLRLLTEMVVDGAVVVSNVCRMKAGISTNLMWKEAVNKWIAHAQYRGFFPEKEAWSCG